MPRYLVKRTFADGLRLPTDAEGAIVAATVVRRNAEKGVTWIHSYVAEARGTTFRIDDGPDPSRCATSPAQTACRATPSRR